MTNLVLADLETTIDNPGQSLYDEPEFQQSHDILTREQPKLKGSILEDPFADDDGMELEFIADGTTQFQPLRYRVRTAYIQNDSVASFVFTFDNKRTKAIGPGFVGAIPFPDTKTVHVTSLSNEPNGGTLFLTLFRRRIPPLLFASQTGINLNGPVATSNADTGQVTGAAGPLATLLQAYNHSRTSIGIKNTDSVANIWIGTSSAVTKTTGYGPVTPGGSVQLFYRGDIWFISDVGTPVVSFFEGYN